MSIQEATTIDDFMAQLAQTVKRSFIPFSTIAELQKVLIIMRRTTHPIKGWDIDITVLLAKYSFDRTISTSISPFAIPGYSLTKYLLSEMPCTCALPRAYVDYEITIRDIDFPNLRKNHKQHSAELQVKALLLNKSFLPNNSYSCTYSGEE